jgi:hypothetical protein
MMQIARRFLPRAGFIVQGHIVKQLGHYQPGWPVLSPNTIARKRRRGIRKSGSIKLMAFPGGGDSPLIDTGEMAQSVTHRVAQGVAVIEADFPAQMHEQDKDVGDFTIPPNNLPARPFMWPGLVNSEADLIDELERFVSREF